MTCGKAVLGGERRKTIHHRLLTFRSWLSGRRPVGKRRKGGLMKFNPIVIAWVVFAIIAVRMGFRMLDGGAEPLHFALMGAAGLAIAALIAATARLYNRHLRRRGLPPAA
jgi:hypothetical protein